MQSVSLPESLFTRLHLWLFFLLLFPGSATAAEREADSRSGPHWEGFRNRLLPSVARSTRQDFGLHATNQIGG